MGYTVLLENSIMKKDNPAAAGSKMLENFISPFDAAVVTRLSENNIAADISAGMNEFGIDPLFAESENEMPTGLIDVVASGEADFALCNDVFGTYRRQAAREGLCYIHPTYGTVSRFGLIPLVCSMDQIGVVCKNPADGFKLLSLIAGKDARDGAMFPEESYTYENTGKKPRVGVPEFAREALGGFAENFDSSGIELDFFDQYRLVMYILCCAEISNNINRYDGIKFGYRAENFSGLNDLYVKTRTQGFGVDTKLAAVMGSFVLSQEQYAPCYEQAMKLRRLIKQSLRFDEYDVIALPTQIHGNRYDNLALYALAPLAGLPCVSFSYKGQGVQLIANVKNENALLTALEASRS